MATIGLPKSSSVIPVARQRARAPAASRPTVVVRDLKAGMESPLRRAGGGTSPVYAPAARSFAGIVRRSRAMSVGAGTRQIPSTALAIEK